MMTVTAFPAFYDPNNAASWAYRPDMNKLDAEAEVWRKRYSFAPAMGDRAKIEFLVIDQQKDFCLPDGTLYVGGRSGSGAIDDSKRIAEFTYGNLGRITKITPTMDTHFAIQIFFSSFWRDTAGNHPPAFTEITAADLRAGKYEIDPAVGQFAMGIDGKPNLGWARKQVLFYAEELERTGRLALYIWPSHAILGSDGHALVGIVHEARMFHSRTRGIESNVAIKGGHALSENYSVFGAEVRARHDGKGDLTQKNMQLINSLINNDAVIVAGEAASHCLAWSVDDLLNEIRAIDDTLVKKVYVLEDCTSPVVTPAFDFTDSVTANFIRWKSEGVHVVRSTDDMKSWPGMDRILGV